LTQIQFHPLANVFPVLTEAELAELAADIGAHGQREPIVLAPDQSILDGRNRYLACLQAGVQPIFDHYDGDEADMPSFVISLNLKRRHLSESQRAMVASALASLPRGTNQHAQICAPSQLEAAELLNVSRRAVQSAASVRTKGAPELVTAVEQGRVSVSAASDVATLPKEEQTEIVAAGPSAVLEAAKVVRAGGNEWYTPARYIEMARAVLGTIDLDPASNAIAQERVKASAFFTAEQDGLAREWRGRVWLNPPYSQPEITQFVDKLIEEVFGRRVTEAILLTNCATDTAWFHRAARAATSVCFTRRRIGFVTPDGDVPGMPRCGQTFFYFGPRASLFGSVFSETGLVYGASFSAPAPLALAA
jgi:phage N-6-adenine-methyltransferase